MHPAALPASTRRRRIVLTVAGATLLLGGVVWWRVERAQERERESRRAAITRDLRLTRGELDGWLERRDEHARLAAEVARPALAFARLADGGEAPAIAMRAREQLEGTTAALQRHAGWQAVWVFDERGEIATATTTGAPSAGEASAVRDALASAGVTTVTRVPLERGVDGGLSLSWVVPVPMLARWPARATPA